MQIYSSPWDKMIANYRRQLLTQFPQWKSFNYDNFSLTTGTYSGHNALFSIMEADIMVLNYQAINNTDLMPIVPSYTD